MRLCFIVEYLIRTIMVITDGLSLVVSSFTDIESCDVYVFGYE